MSTTRLSQGLAEVKPHPVLGLVSLLFEIVKFLSLKERLKLGTVSHSLREVEVKVPLQDNEKEIMKERLAFSSNAITRSIFLKRDTILKFDLIEPGCGSRWVVFTEPLAHRRYNYASENEEIALERIKQMAIYMVNNPNSYHCRNQIMVAFSKPLRACMVVGAIGGLASAASCWFTSWCLPSFASSLIGPAAGVGAAVGGGGGYAAFCYPISQIDHYKRRDVADEKEQLSEKDARTLVATKILEDFNRLRSVHKRLSFIAMMPGKSLPSRESKDDELALPPVPDVRSGR